MKWQIIIFTILIGCLLYTCNQQKKEIKQIITYDTIMVTKIDTMIVYFPQERIVERKVIDTMRIYTRDTVFIVDREQRVYEGEQYKAYVSGYRSELDSIHIYDKTKTVYIETERIIQSKAKRFGLGIQIGYGFTGARASPYVGVGLQYNFRYF